MKSLRNQELAEQNESKDSRKISNLLFRPKMWWASIAADSRWSPRLHEKYFCSKRVEDGPESSGDGLHDRLEPARGEQQVDLGGR